MGAAAVGGGGGGKSGDVRAGGAFVEVSAKDSLSNALKGMGAKVKAFAAGLRAAGGGLTLLSGAALAPLTALFKSGVDRAEGIDKTAKSLGFTIEQMQKLQYAADAAAVSIDDVIQNPGKFAGLMGDAPLMDPQAIKDATAFNQEFRKTLADLQIAITPVVSSFLPFVKTIGEFVRENAGAVKVIAMVAGGVGLLGSALMAAGVALPVVLIGLKAVVAVVGFFVSLLGLVVGLLGALGYAAVKFTDTGKDAFEGFKSVFMDVFGVFSDTFKGIIAAIGGGDFRKAWEIATAGASALWKMFCVGITRVWVGVKDSVLDTWRDMIVFIKKALNDFWAWSQRNDPTGYLSGGKSDAEINEERDRRNVGLDADRRDKQNADNKFRAEQLRKARAEVEAAKAKLKELTAGAAAGDKPDRPRTPDDYKYFAGVASRGTFRALGDARQFGEGTNGKKEEQVLKVQKEAVHQLDLLNRGIKVLADELRQARTVT